MRTPLRPFHTVLFAATLACTHTHTQSACGQVLYTVEILNSPACTSGNALLATRLSNNATVVGSGSPCFSLAFLPFRWTPSTGVQYLNLGPGIADGWATNVRDDGTIIGYCGSSPLGPMKGFVWKDGQYQLFSAPNPADWVHPYGIDATGAVYGYLHVNNGNGNIPFCWKDGVYLPTGLENGPYEYLLFDANDNGVVVGHHSSLTPPVSAAFRLIGGELSYIGIPPGFDTSEVRGVNRQGTMVGRFRKTYVPGVTTTHHGMIAEGNDPVVVLPIEAFDHDNCNLRDINDIGQAVGMSNCNACGAARAVPAKAILVQDGVVHNLNDLMAVPIPFKLFEGVAINDRGQIACSTNTAKNLVLLTPIVEPPDITIDGKVDQRDLAIIIEHWGTIGPLTPLRADVNENGAVDAHDLALVLGAWTPR